MGKINAKRLAKGNNLKRHRKLLSLLLIIKMQFSLRFVARCLMSSFGDEELWKKPTSTSSCLSISLGFHVHFFFLGLSLSWFSLFFGFSFHILTYDRHLATPPGTVTLFVPRPARIHAGIGVLLHGTDGQRAVRLDTLPYVIRQLSSSALPVDLFDGVAGHRALQIQCLAGDGGYLRNQSNVWKTCDGIENERKKKRQLVS